MDPKFKAKIIQSIQQTPVLSPSASRLLQVAADPKHSLKDMIEIIRGDFALTAQLLRVANSVAFSPLQPVTSLDRAVAYLGEVYLIGLAISSCAAAVFDSPLTGYEGHKRDLWRHQLYCAIASRLISRHAKQEMPGDLAFTGGLLHDIGKAILSGHIVDSAGEILDGITDGRYLDYMDAEEKLFGMNHTQVGHVLAQHWKLPPVLQEVILHHHNPEAASPEHRVLVYAVHLGDALSMLAGYDTGSDGLKYNLGGGERDLFTLSDAKLEALQIEAGQGFDKFEQSINPGNQEPK
ncbi:MAG: HDOD domain-containing protein [Desulfobulbaceae bacterium]|nr:HDOD domain-containing protein [Desulfobulbaceae bacterium]